MWEDLLKNVLASSIVLVIFLLLLVAIYYVISLKTVNKNKQRYVKLHETLKPGVRVEFAGGFVGTVRKVNDEFCDIEIAKDMIVTVSRFSVSRILDKN